MKTLSFIGQLACCVVVCLSLAGADSLQLRNGRHLQGKYIGGTTTSIGFMAGASVEYFSTSDVLALIFDNSNDSPLSGLRPNPMKGRSPANSPRIRQAALIISGNRDGGPMSNNTGVSESLVARTVSASADIQPTPSQ